MGFSTIVVPFSEENGNKNWDLVRQYFALRKTVFVEELGWDLDHRQGWEYEEYDREGAVYVLALSNKTNTVIGGARLLQTNQEIFISPVGDEQSSYMIRDALLGRLPGIPNELCVSNPPKDPRIWELTRLISTQGLDVSEMILKTANEYLVERGAKECLFLGAPGFMRMARKMGFEPQPLGNLVGNKDGRFLAFACAVVGRNEDVQEIETELLVESIQDLTEKLIQTASRHFAVRGMRFDRHAFCGEILPTLEFISETAHFTGAKVFANHENESSEAA